MNLEVHVRFCEHLRGEVPSGDSTGGLEVRDLRLPDLCLTQLLTIRILLGVHGG